MPCKATEATQEQLSDRSKISNEQKIALVKWQDFIRDLNEKLAANYVQYDTKNGQAVASTIEAGATEINTLASELSNGSISWGEFNRRRVELSKRIQENQKNALTYS